MAVFHFSAKVISRAKGSSAVAAAAYRSASRLHDKRLGRSHDFTNKAGVVHSEILSPSDAPDRWQDREVLWNEVEAREVRKDAQLAREIEFAIPRELNYEEGIGLARDFVRREFVDRGMVADLNVHWDVGADGMSKPHAHVMLGLREIGPEGFGAKARDWNRTELLEHWRSAWSEQVNERLSELGIDARVDHRTLKDQGIELEPQHKIGAVSARREDRGEDAERLAEHRDISRRNGERIIAEPRVALHAITQQQATFTAHDLARFIHRHTDGKDQFDWAMAGVNASPELIALGRDGRGEARFTSREMLSIEQSMSHSADRLADRAAHSLTSSTLDNAVEQSDDRGFRLSEEQLDAARHVVGAGDLALVVGYAGSGKSAMLGAARTAWEADGYRVKGAALSGIAAENLETGSGITSRTLASYEHAWARGHDQLGSDDVLVIDEAGLVGSRQMERVLAHAEGAGAKVVLVGDAEQLQAKEAGAAFRSLTERHGAAEITQVHRQTEDWQREATRHLATGRTADAVEAYQDRGAVSAYSTRDAAIQGTVDAWEASRREDPAALQLMLAYTRADAKELNRLARDRLSEAGELGEHHEVETEQGARSFSAGDRLLFLRNERSMGVKNGSMGRVEAISGRQLSVQLDNGTRVSFDTKDYAAIDHGYATTIHKAQGSTVDHAHVVASRNMDRHAAYVALSRHRESLSLHYGEDELPDGGALRTSLGRERAKDSTLDYPGAPQNALGPSEALGRNVGLETASLQQSAERGHVDNERERERSR
ncbi:Ti-type conjugative transfer relaxase TraA [Phenylobacterium sp.]|uniref:Ti-type conjugative transfer relaxase TraA n=1 Tax=Phenylobacterium sp. TaxID=1871053 RepID=UPI0011FE4D22|nr:Ti-type conjugative transfer relaxase TraA [Phenylobacterium sp.]THD61622.1 MAG: Ti-type conjugative transfer relaxase TraA [Phenylobacterium sp.]